MTCPRSHSQAVRECGLSPGMSLGKGVNRYGRDRISELEGTEVPQTVTMFSEKKYN